MEIIKNQYFSQDNFDFILIMIQKQKNYDTNLLHESAFKNRNNIFNSFINTMYTQKKNVNPNSIEELLITLNKMTIDTVIDDLNNTPIPQQPQQVQPVQSIQQVQPIQPIQQVQPQQPQQVQPVQSIQQVQPVQPQQVQPVQAVQPIQKLQSDIKINNTVLHFFSASNYNNKYVFQLGKVYNKLVLKQFNLYNNLYNITELNNRIELQENTIKNNIIIPIGSYTLKELLECIEKLLNDKTKSSNKYKMSFNKNKNRIIISAENTFTIRFVEMNNSSVHLRVLLGFSNKEYMNNNSYTSDNNPILNIYDNIYLKIVDSDEYNNKIVDNFRYFDKIHFNQLDTFSQDISFNFDTTLNINSDNITLELYCRHNTHDQFYKINSKIYFDIVLKT